MNQFHSRLPHGVLAAFCALAALAAVLILLRPASAQEVAVLPASEAVSGEVTDRFGDEWLFAACAGDVISITMQSDEYDAYLELYPPTGRKSLAEAEVERGEDAARLAGVELDESGEYIVIAAGESRNDSGAYTLTLTYGGSTEEDLESFDGWLLPGEAVSGTIESRFGQEWAFRGCAGDVVDIDMESEEFDAYLELYPPTGRRALAEDDNGGRRTDALIEGVELEESGVYVVVAGGAERMDAGGYRLLLSVERAAIVETPTATKQATRTPTRRPTTRPTTRPTRRPTATRTRTPTPEPEVCTVQVSSLNLRSGPSVAYAPPIGGIPRDAALIPLARNADGTWIEIEVVSTGRRGWVNSAPQYVECAVDVASLSMGVIPPTPTPSPTPPPTATPTPEPVAQVPTPTPPSFVALPGPSPGDDSPLQGDVVSEDGIFSSGSGKPTFRDRIFFRLFVRERGRSRDGDGVDRVEIRVIQQDENGNDKQEVYSRTERVSGYCAFGGGEPNCDVVRIGRDARWPDRDTRIENGDYEVRFDVVRDGDDSPSVNWRVPFRIDNADLGNGGGNKPDIVARVAQTGPGTTSTSISGRAVFQVEAYDPSRGSRDGDGIENVDIRVLGPDGREVYQRTENNVAYCAFSGGEPDCVIWDFNAEGGNWPSGESLQPGPHRVQATVNAEDGRQKSIELTVQIQ